MFYSFLYSFFCLQCNRCNRSLLTGFLALNANVSVTHAAFVWDGDGAEECNYNDRSSVIKFGWEDHGFRYECMREFYYEMLAHNPFNRFVNDHYYKVYIILIY